MTAGMDAAAPIVDVVHRISDVAGCIVDSGLDTAVAVEVANQMVGFGFAGAPGRRQLLDSLAEWAQDLYRTSSSSKLSASISKARGAGLTVAAIVYPEG